MHTHTHREAHLDRRKAIMIGEKFSLVVQVRRNAHSYTYVDEMIFYEKNRREQEKKENEREREETEEPQFLLPSALHSSLLLERCRQLHEEI